MRVPDGIMERELSRSRGGGAILPFAGYGAGDFFVVAVTLGRLLRFKPRDDLPQRRFRSLF